MSTLAADNPIPPDLLAKLHACGVTRLTDLQSRTEEELLSTCQLSLEALGVLRERMSHEGLRFRPGEVRYPFISPLLLREVAATGIDISQTSITAVGLPAWAETPLLARGIETVGQLATSSTFYVRAALGLGGRPQSLLRQQLEDYLLRLLMAERHAAGGTAGDEASLRTLPLSPRTLGALRRAGIFTVDQLRRLSDPELARLRGLGPTRLVEIRAVLPGTDPTPAAGTDVVVQAEAVSVRPDVARRSVRELPLPGRIVGRLEASGLRTIGQLVSGGEERLRAVPRIGPASIRCIRAELERYLLGALEEVGSSVPGMIAEVQAHAAATTLDERLAGLLGNLNSDRLRRLVRWRYGLDGRIWTLEEVGRQLGVSRERVRQLEAMAVEELRRNHAAEVECLSRGPHEALAAVGGVAPFSYVVEQLPALFEIEKLDPLGAARLLMELTEGCHQLPGRRCALTDAPLREVEAIDDAVVSYLRKRVEPVPVPQLTAEIARTRAYPRVIKQYPSFSLAARARANPLTYVTPPGGVALKEWTRSRLDDSIRALRDLGEPSHYRAVAKLVQERLHGVVSISVDAIHNLMLSEAAFVRVGKGVFALAEWQEPEPGTVRAIAALLTESGQPMHRGEIARALGQPERAIERALITRPEFAPAGGGYYKLAGHEYDQATTSRRRRTTEAVGAGCARVLITPATLRSGTLALNATLRPLFPAEGDVRAAWAGCDEELPHKLHRGGGHISGLRSFLRLGGVQPGDHVYIEYRPGEDPPHVFYTSAQWRAATMTKADSRERAKPSEG
jgi:DNA-directed RNA polymerase alpha subunit